MKVRYFASIKDDVPTVQAIESADQLHESGLTGPVWSYDSGDLLIICRQGHRLQSLETAEVLGNIDTS